MGDDSAGVARLIPDPYFYLLATSDAAENAKLYLEADRKRASGAPFPMLAAVRELASSQAPVQAGRKA
jgi:hypothetical protein